MNIIQKCQFKMISIITCNYNLGHLLTETVDSVLNQNIDKLESIIIDANSDDNSQQIIKKLSIKDQRIKFLSEDDEGHFYGVNKGLKLVKGNIIGMLHCSDVYEKNIFDLVNEEFKKDPDLWILGGSNILKFKNKKQYLIKRKAKYLNVNDIVNFDFPAIESTFFRKEVFTEFGNFSTNRFLKRCHTNMFINYFLGTIEKQKKIKMINQNFSYHLEHENIRPENARNTKTKSYYSNGRKLASYCAIKKFDKILNQNEKQILYAQNIIYDLKYFLFIRNFKKFFKNLTKLFEMLRMVDFLKTFIYILISVLKSYQIQIGSKK